MTKDNSISLCKGIAIICMVAGHSWINSPIEKGTRLFDMTMFFLLSGYCFKEKYLTNFSSFLIKRAKGLWIPYVKWGIISVLVHNTFLQLGVYSVDSESNPINYFNVTDIIYRILGCFIFGLGPDGFLGGYWFLKDMFFSMILSWIIIKIGKGITNGIILGGVLC